MSKDATKGVGIRLVSKGGGQEGGERIPSRCQMFVWLLGAITQIVTRLLKLQQHGKTQLSSFAIEAIQIVSW